MARSLAAMAVLAIAWCGVCRAQPISFPGAVGQGSQATGGRGGDVYHVTTLDDYASGQPSIVGSLRHAIASAAGPRTIVFDVGGSLELARPLSINRDNLTIAGQTAPTGITLWGYPTSVSGPSNVILRYMRFRTGDFNVVGGNGNMDLQGDAADGLNVTNGANRIILDHVSASWSLDEALSVTKSRNVTVQHSIISASLNSSLHPKGDHGYGSLVRGEVTAAEQAAGDGGYTFYGDLWAHHDARNPSFGGQQNLDPGQPESERRRNNVNLVNSVVFNWDSQPTHRNTDGDVYANIVNNYYVNGPLSSSSYIFNENNPGNTFVYQQGNYHDSDQDAVHDGFLVDTPGEIATAFIGFEAADSINSTGGGSPYNFYSWVEDAVISAEDAYARVVESVGASRWRDVIDQRVRDELAARTGSIINSQEIYRDEFDVLPGIDDLPFAQRPAGWDTDGDGMSNDFEDAYHLDKSSAADRNGFDLSSVGYTNLEMYLNALVAPMFPDEQLVGDYNNDGSVDAADYTFWRDHRGGTFPMLNEVASIGAIDDADYAAWVANFGAVAAGAGSAAQFAPADSAGADYAVPEPSSLLILVSGLAWVGVLRAW